jgi:hypothetical protein
VILLGLLLMLGAIALSSAVVWTNQDVFEKPAGTFTLLGYSMDLTVSQVYLAGLIIGALGFMGITMIMSGIGRRATRRAATRRQLREQEDQLREQESQLRDMQLERERAADARHRHAEDAREARNENLANH